MNPVATNLLSLPARDVIGTVVKFRSPHTDRVRVAPITSISASGVRVLTKRDGLLYFLAWSDLIEVVEEGAVCDMLAALEGIQAAFPDLAEFEDKNGHSLAPLAAEVEAAISKAKGNQL